MRRKRLGVGAAQGLLQDGRLDLEVALALHVTADARDDLTALAEGVAHLGIHDEVHVALAVADLAIREAMELLGQGAQRLGEQLHMRGAHRELTATRAHDGARGANDVAEVKLAEKCPVVLGQVVDAAEELNGASHVLEHDKASLALLAESTDAPRHRVLVSRVRTCLEVRVTLLELRGVSRHRRADGIRLDSGVDERLPAATANGPLVVDGLAAGGGVLGHCCFLQVLRLSATQLGSSA